MKTALFAVFVLLASSSLARQSVFGRRKETAERESNSRS
jgi:hypothetical protein